MKFAYNRGWETELFNSNNKKLLTNLGIYNYKAFKYISEQVLAS